jgi:2-polyprenyl-3-methyl-5-hydroxy-6-metoxy-1,4-benzoquinol methylase
MKIFIGKKKTEFYNGLKMMADLGLHKQVCERLIAELPIGSKILDFGAGQGALSERLVDAGFEITSVDIDDANFKSKKSTFVKVNFDSQESIMNFVDNNKEKFDAVLGIEVIEHVEDQWNYVRQLMNLLKPGGLILITTPNTTSWLSRLIFFFTGKFHQFSDSDLSYGHISPITEWELRLNLKYANAKSINTYPAGTLPPLYLTGFNKFSLLNLLILPLRLFMKGTKDGWCIMLTARKEN